MSFSGATESAILELIFNATAFAGFALDAAEAPYTAPQLDPANSIEFPACSGGNAIAEGFCVGPPGGGASAYLFAGSVTPPISISTNVVPQLSTSTTITLM